MPNLSAAPTGKQKSFRTNHSRDRVNHKPLAGLTYYPMTYGEWLDIRRELIPSEIDVLMCLRTLSPFGDRPIDITVRGLARDMRLDPATVSRALRQLNKCGYLDLEVLPSKIRVYPRGILYERMYARFEEIDFLEKPRLEVCKEELLQTSTIVNNIVESELEVVVNNNFQHREFKSGEGFGLSKVNQDPVNKVERETEKAIAPDAEILDQATTVKEQKKSVSGWESFVAPGNDPEFFAFVVRRTAKLPQPPADAPCAAEGWIRKQGHILYPQYVAWKFRQTVLAEPAPTSAPLATELPELTLAQRLAKYQNLWQIPTCRKGIRLVIAAHPEWGLQIGKAGPEIIGEKAAIAC
ncbi:hypothetical protein [Pantanalinema sp. GBBB05]|uniref:hypothetical protein n=1 Tax=Pantanalinema sp. GBBB05 TaxID=2604139 RepID=UPI001DAEBA2C|nr:MarR family transcriptional regulator [Pantanalinema sp. GBBB05]